MIGLKKSTHKKNKKAAENQDISIEEVIKQRKEKEREKQRQEMERSSRRQQILNQKKRKYIEGNECKGTGTAQGKCNSVRPDSTFLGENRHLIDAIWSPNDQSEAFLVDVINSIFKTIGKIDSGDHTVIQSLNGEKLKELFRKLDYSIFWEDFSRGRSRYCPLGNMQVISEVTKAVDCKHGLDFTHKRKYLDLLSAYLDSIILILENSNVLVIPQEQYFLALFNLIKKIMTATGTNIMEVDINKWGEFSQKINEIYEYNIFNISCSKGEDDYTCGRGINSVEESGKNYILLFDTKATNNDEMNMITWVLWSEATFPEHSRSNIEITNQIKAKQLQSLMPTGESKQVVMARDLILKGRMRTRARAANARARAANARAVAAKTNNTTMEGGKKRKTRRHKKRRRRRKSTRKKQKHRLHITGRKKKTRKAYKGRKITHKNV